jgi:hypothetical protein
LKYFPFPAKLNPNKEKTMTDTPTTAPDPIAALKAAELALVLAPLNKFLTDLQQPGANQETAVQEFGKLQLSLLANAPGAESVGINGVAAVLQQKLNSVIASVATPAAPPAPPAA